jgi:hypothetical protein
MYTGGGMLYGSGLKRKGDKFSSPGFYEHVATVCEMMNSMQEMCDKWNKVLNPTGVEIPERNDSRKVSPQKIYKKENSQILK